MSRAQQSQASSAAYAGSKLSQLNQARRRAANLAPLKDSDAMGAEFLAKKAERVVTLTELHLGGPKVDALSGDFEPFLLVEDFYNPGRCNTVWMAAGTLPANRQGNYECDTAHGAVLLPGNTLVYWK